MKSDLRKTVRKSFRITAEEEEVFRGQCEKYGMSDSAYFRYLLAQTSGSGKKDIRPKEEYLAIRALTDEINHIGVNINQIVKNVNMHYYSDTEKKKLFAMMQLIIQKVKGL